MAIKRAFDSLSEKIENWNNEIVNILLKRHPYLSGRKILVDIRDKDFSKHSASGEIVVDGKIIFPFVVREKILEDLDIVYIGGKHYSATKKRVLGALFDYSFFSRVETKEEKEILKNKRNELRGLFGGDGNDIMSGITTGTFDFGKHSFDSFLVKRSSDGWKLHYSGPKGDLLTKETDPFKMANFIAAGLYEKTASDDPEIFLRVKAEIRKFLTKMAVDTRIVLKDKRKLSHHYLLKDEEDFMTKKASEYYGPCRVFDITGKSSCGFIVKAQSVCGEGNFFVKEGGEFCEVFSTDEVCPESFGHKIEKIASRGKLGERGFFVGENGCAFGPFSIEKKATEKTLAEIMAEGKLIKVAFTDKVAAPKYLKSVKTLNIPEDFYFVSATKPMRKIASPSSLGKYDDGMSITIKVEPRGRYSAFSEKFAGVIEENDEDVFVNRMSSAGFMAPEVEGILADIKSSFSTKRASDRVVDLSGGKGKRMNIVAISNERGEEWERIKEAREKFASELNFAEMATSKFISGDFDPKKYVDDLPKIEQVENSLSNMLVEARKAGDSEDFPIKRIKNAVEGLGSISAYLNLVKDAG